MGTNALGGPGRGRVAAYEMRVSDDMELYYQVVANCPHMGGDVMQLEALARDMLMRYTDGQVGMLMLRARLFLGCIRKECGRRKDLNSDQLRLLEGI